MKILNRNAASLLFEKAKSLMPHHASWRSIYLNLSDKHEQYSHALREHFFVKPITDLLAGEDGYIYVCDDGDIVVLFQGALKPIAQKLGNHFGDLKLEEESESNEDGMFTIFDLSQYWDSFLNLCKNKAIEAAYAAEKPMPVFARYALGRSEAAH